MQFLIAPLLVSDNELNQNTAFIKLATQFLNVQIGLSEKIPLIIKIILSARLSDFHVSSRTCHFDHAKIPPHFQCIMSVLVKLGVVVTPISTPVNKQNV